MTRGIIYIIGGRKYAIMAMQSVLSLRKNGGKAANLPIHIHFIGDIIFNEQFNSLKCNLIKHNDLEISHHTHRKIKSIVMQNPGFDQHIMIDADTFVQGDFYSLFDCIPENGVAGIEDGNFGSHLQMAKFLFLTKHAPKDEVRSIVYNMLSVDYGSDSQFPPYYNVGVIGFSKNASIIIGTHLLPLLEKLSLNKFYNTHDEQLPINAIMHLFGIKGIACDPIYNYTRSRMRKNKKEGTHDNIKSNVRIIHNRHYATEADWVDIKSIHDACKEILLDS